MRSLNPFFNESMLATQLSRYQERPFTLTTFPYENSCIYNGSFLPHHQLKDSRLHVSCFNGKLEFSTFSYNLCILLLSHTNKRRLILQIKVYLLGPNRR
ncbi:hypothetical protein H5410_042500 [Solanum commersonii]|uniref:Uncharacterized protein n=1 Tax=Solanum commersonii TaxID=4109 RepID=A0A9J5XW73_SOLCO|nr:hypothetical protein H5410_042500 [Solanum commersonii]